MNSKAITALVVVIIVIVGGIFLFHKSYSPQSSNAPTQNSTNSQPTMSEMPMQNNSGSTTQTTTAPIGKNAVTIQNFNFSPATLTVKVGDTVTWTNQDSVGHSATSDNGTFDTGVLAQGSSGSFTFTKAGTYTYHCSVHPMMHGTIVVE